MAFVLKLERSSQMGSSILYTLTEDGKQTKEGKAINDLNMDEYWNNMEETINNLIDEKVEGWDQVRIYFEVTCRPIYNFSVVGKDGRKRDFGIYG